MTIRRLTFDLLILYALLTLYTLIGPSLGLPYHPFFTPLLTLVAFTFALLHGSQNLGWKHTLLLLGLTFAISLLFECVGVATGLIFGAYHYTDKLGYKFLDLVPLLIPLAWFMMTYPSLVISRMITPTFKNVIMASPRCCRGCGHHDRLGPGHGPYDGRGWSLGVGPGRGILRHPSAQLLGLVADLVHHLLPVPVHSSHQT